MAILRHPETGAVVQYPDDAVPTLEASGWVDVYPPPAEPEPGWTKDQLVAAAEERGLPKSGTKDELIARLQGGGTAEPETAESETAESEAETLAEPEAEAPAEPEAADVGEPPG